MNGLTTTSFFKDVNFNSIVDTIKNIYMSDGAMSTLLDFERCLDDADLYAFANWINGELVDGPTVGRYSVKCVFMWPYKLMPDPRGALRLINVGCSVTFSKGEIKVPVEVKEYDDFVPSTRYPKMKKHKVWYVKIEIPVSLTTDIKNSSIDLFNSEIDLAEIEDAYNNDLDDLSKTHESGSANEGPLGQPQSNAM
jgi:hypothetical protein